MREDIPLLGRWIARAFQQYWRVARGLHLFAEACVLDKGGRVLMIENENGGSWELPAGRVLKDETLETALRRILRDASGIEVNGKPELAFFYACREDHQTGVFTVRNWREVSSTNFREKRFFSPDSLPPGTAPGIAERIRRCLEHRTTSEV
ncbi:MAG: NUDIX domain-containing protein [Proteobacteria bacterium]|nr:NUDIX domain-containing protein [Pseudomonadota bacterium]